MLKLSARICPLGSGDPPECAWAEGTRQRVGFRVQVVVCLNAMRRKGGNVGGGTLRGGSSDRSAVEAMAMVAIARSMATWVAADVDCTPLILRTNWRAAASISCAVATGSRPRNVVMFRHMPRCYGNGSQRCSYLASLGNPRPRSAMMLRCISSVPPPIRMAYWLSM